MTDLLIRDLAQAATPGGNAGPLRGPALRDVRVVEDAFVLCRDDLIRLEDLPEHLIPHGDHVNLPTGETLRDVEKAAILQSLQRNQGKKVAAASELGIDKNTLRRKMIRLGIRPTAGQP